MATDARADSGWALIRRGPFARLFWAGFVTSVGDWAALFAQITLADSIAGATGILVVLAARLLPGLLGGAIGGLLADRGSRKAVMVVADVGRGVLVLSLAWVGDLGTLFAISIALELLTLMGQPARTAVLPNLVPERSLLLANSMTLAAAYGTFPIGAALSWMIGLAPPIALLGLIPSTTEASVFAVDALTFFASAAVLATTAIPDAISRERRPAGERFDMKAPLRDLADGVRFVARGSVRPIVVGMSTALFGGGVLLVLGRDYAVETLAADEAGFFALLTALGTGAGLGIVALTMFGDRVARRDVTFAFATTLTGVALMALALVQTVVGGMGWATVMGMGAGAAYVSGFTHLHETVADDLRGRTFAALFSLMRVGLLVSMAIAAPVASAMEGRFDSPFDDPARNTIFLGGAIVLLSGLGVVWSVRDMLRTPRFASAALRSVAAAARLLRGNGTDPGARDDDGEWGPE